MVHECGDALSIYKLLKSHVMNPEKLNGGSRLSTTRPHNKTELAELLGVSVHILNLMIKPVKDQLGEPIGGLYSVKQVELMVNTYGIKK